VLSHAEYERRYRALERRVFSAEKTSAAAFMDPSWTVRPFGGALPLEARVWTAIARAAAALAQPEPELVLVEIETGHPGCAVVCRWSHEDLRQAVFTRDTFFSACDALVFDASACWGGLSLQSLDGVSRAVRAASRAVDARARLLTWNFELGTKGGGGADATEALRSQLSVPS
jgi:hypothetical protein